MKVILFENLHYIPDVNRPYSSVPRAAAASPPSPQARVARWFARARALSGRAPETYLPRLLFRHSGIPTFVPPYKHMADLRGLGI